ncbi:lipoprotein [Alphaproteobacteria bacterium]|nr:lipoprotein [Alphaproteobacteria bacterium]
MRKISKFLILIFITATLSSCNTVVGSIKGAAKDTKAFYIYSRDAITQRDVSDTSD